MYVVVAGPCGPLLKPPRFLLINRWTLVQVTWDLVYDATVVPQTELKMIALRVLREMLRFLPNHFENYAEITLIHILELHKDGSKEVRACFLFSIVENSLKLVLRIVKNVALGLFHMTMFLTVTSCMRRWWSQRRRQPCHSARRSHLCFAFKSSRPWWVAMETKLLAWKYLPMPSSDVLPRNWRHRLFPVSFPRFCRYR